MSVQSVYGVGIVREIIYFLLPLLIKLPRCVTAVEVMSLLFNRLKYSFSVHHLPQFIEQDKNIKYFRVVYMCKQVKALADSNIN